MDGRNLVRRMRRHGQLDAAQELAVCRCPQSIVAYLVESSREHVLEITAQEFFAGQREQFPRPLRGVLVAQADVVLID